MRSNALLAELGLALSAGDRDDIVAAREPGMPVVARMKSVAASIKTTCKRHPNCVLWVSVTRTRARDDILAASYRWVRDASVCSAAVHAEQSRSIKLGFGMKLRGL